MAKQIAHVKGELLRWARESIGMDISSAAAAAGISPERLEAWELSDDEKPTIPQLRELARVYKRPLAAFYLPEPPTDFMVPHDFRKLPGDTPAPYSPQLRTELRKAQFRRQTAIELADEIPTAAFVGSASITAPPEVLSTEIRRLLNVTLEEQFAWTDFYDALNAWKNAIEHLGVLVFHFSEVAVSEVRGFSFSQIPFPIIGINGSDSPPGRIFSLIHELCHLLLGQSGSCDFEERSQIPSHESRIEAFCNRAAGAVLVPLHALTNEPLVAEFSNCTEWPDDRLNYLAKKYRVSTEVILRRLLIAGKTNEAFYKARREAWLRERQGSTEGQGGFMTVPRRAVRTLGQPFIRLILDAYYNDRITTSDLSEYIGVRIKHIPDIEGLLATHNRLTGGDR